MEGKLPKAEYNSYKEDVTNGEMKWKNGYAIKILNEASDTTLCYIDVIGKGGEYSCDLLNEMARQKAVELGMLKLPHGATTGIKNLISDEWLTSIKAKTPEEGGGGGDDDAVVKGGEIVRLCCVMPDDDWDTILAIASAADPTPVTNKGNSNNSTCVSYCTPGFTDFHTIYLDVPINPWDTPAVLEYCCRELSLNKEQHTLLRDENGIMTLISLFEPGDPLYKNNVIKNNNNDWIHNGTPSTANETRDWLFSIETKEKKKRLVKRNVPGGDGDGCKDTQSELPDLNGFFNDDCSGADSKEEDNSNWYFNDKSNSNNNNNNNNNIDLEQDVLETKYQKGSSFVSSPVRHATLSYVTCRVVLPNNEVEAITVTTKGIACADALSYVCVKHGLIAPGISASDYFVLTDQRCKRLDEKSIIAPYETVFVMRKT